MEQEQENSIITTHRKNDTSSKNKENIYNTILEIDRQESTTTNNKVYNTNIGKGEDIAL